MTWRFDFGHFEGLRLAIQAHRDPSPANSVPSPRQGPSLERLTGTDALRVAEPSLSNTASFSEKTSPFSMGPPASPISASPSKKNQGGKDEEEQEGGISKSFAMPNNASVPSRKPTLATSASPFSSTSTLSRLSQMGLSPLNCPTAAVENGTALEGNSTVESLVLPSRKDKGAVAGSRHPAPGRNKTAVTIGDHVGDDDAHEEVLYYEGSSSDDNGGNEYLKGEHADSLLGKFVRGALEGQKGKGSTKFSSKTDKLDLAVSENTVQELDLNSICLSFRCIAFF